MTKTQIIILSAVVGAIIISALIAINNKVMPYYAFIHSTQEIIGPSSPFAGHDAKNTISIPGVDQVLMGWLDMFMFLLAFSTVFFLPGCLVGFFVRESRMDEDVEKEIQRRRSTKTVTADGITIGGYRAEAIERTLRTNYLELVSDKKKYEKDKKALEEEKEEFEKTKKEAENAIKQMAAMKQDYANRLDKITRLEKTNEKLEKRVCELETEVVELQRENLKLDKKILEYEKSK